MFERLTFRDELGVACYKWELPNKTMIIANKAISRLAAYEDSGLSPEEVQKLAKEKARVESATHYVYAIDEAAKEILDLMGQRKKEGLSYYR